MAIARLTYRNSGHSCSYIVGILTNKANISIQYYLVPYSLSTDSKTRDLETWMTLNEHFAPFCFAPVCLELCILAFEA